MTSKSMGQFIQALRKANGMTQQNVADRLGVSNKAVSRWERDECAPDISVIPALAELLGVTCDELLKGERLITEVQIEKAELKVDKQIKSIVNKTISRFRSMTWVSMALSLVGMIIMFGISYGFYRRILGFTIELVFVVTAIIVTIIAISKMKESRQDNELFEDLKPELDYKFKNTLAKYSYASLFTALSVVVLTFPVMYFPTYDSYAVITMESYVTVFLPVAVLVLVCFFMASHSVYIRIITGGANSKYTQQTKLLNKMQIVLIVVAGTLFFIAPYMQTYDVFIGSVIAVLVGLGCVLACIIVFVTYAVRHKGNNKDMIPVGIRNCFIAICTRILGGVMQRYFIQYDGASVYDIQDDYCFEYLLGFVICVIIAYIGCELLLFLQKKNN